MAKINELELKLATAVGAIDVLRGKGVPGGFSVKGTFNANTAYNYGDVVAYNGASWVATRDNPGPLPGSGWQLLAASGRRGPRGERGERGLKGEPGLSAEPAGPSLKGVHVNAATYTLSLLMSDGIVHKIDLRSCSSDFITKRGKLYFLLSSSASSGTRSSPRFVWETLYKHVILAGVIARLLVLKISIACDPHARAYMDRALAPVGDDDDPTLDLLTKTAGASTAIAHIRKVAELTRGIRVN